MKFVMDLRGYRGGILRAPLLPLTESEKAAIAKVAAGLEPAAAGASS